MAQRRLLRLLDVLNQDPRSGDPERVGLDIEPFESAGLKVLLQHIAAVVRDEAPRSPRGQHHVRQLIEPQQCGVRAMGLGNQALGRAHAGQFIQQRRRLEAGIRKAETDTITSSPSRSFGSLAQRQLRTLESPGRKLQPRDANAIPRGEHSCEEVAFFGIEQGIVGQCAGGDDAGHFAADHPLAVLGSSTCSQTATRYPA